MSYGGKASVHEVKRNMSKRRPWTKEEREAVHEHLGKFIRLRQLPGKRHCDEAKKDSRLKNREWSTIKYYIKNQIQKM